MKPEERMEDGGLKMEGRPPSSILHPPSSPEPALRLPVRCGCGATFWLEAGKAWGNGRRKLCDACRVAARARWQEREKARMAADRAEARSMHLIPIATYAEVAAKLGMSPQSVEQVELTALLKLKRAMHAFWEEHTAVPPPPPRVLLEGPACGLCAQGHCQRGLRCLRQPGHPQVGVRDWCGHFAAKENQ